jgi:hypothetical protein
VHGHARPQRRERIDDARSLHVGSYHAAYERLDRAERAGNGNRGERVVGHERDHLAPHEGQPGAGWLAGSRDRWDDDEDEDGYVLRCCAPPLDLSTCYAADVILPGNLHGIPIYASEYLGERVQVRFPKPGGKYQKRTAKRYGRDPRNWVWRGKGVYYVAAGGIWCHPDDVAKMRFALNASG